jgi:epoxyqueuosine reductase
VPDQAYVDELRAVGTAAGLDAVGVASATPFDEARTVLRERRRAGLHGGMQFTYRNPDRSSDPTVTFPWARSLVVGALGYRRARPVAGGGGTVGEAVSDAGGDARDARTAGSLPGPAARVARYAWSDVYGELRDALDVVASRLAADGWRARTVADDNALVDRAAAHRAGIGWYGKSSNVLIPGRGSWFVLGSVVTDAPLPPGTPVEDGCGSCRRCIDGCPTGAIVAPGVLDARRCLAWLVQADGVFPREHRVALGDRIYGCDDCQEVCPPNRADERRHPDRAAPPGATAEVDLLGLLAAGDDELMARHGRWYVPRRQPRFLRRNALVALGNAGDGCHAGTVATLGRYLASPDPVLRVHAAWAARRLGRADLVDVLAGDDDPLVRSELAAPDPPVGRTVG